MSSSSTQPEKSGSSADIVESTQGTDHSDANPGSSLSAIIARLPTPADRPDADWVIYDGHCVFCTRGVATVNQLDFGKRLAFISLHDEAVARRCPELTHEQMMKQMYVATADGRTYGGAAAIRYLTRRLPVLWIFAPLLHIPFSLPLWQWAYLFVARQRYRILGKTHDCDDGACKLHK